jgi:hypothetical protein
LSFMKKEGFTGSILSLCEEWFDCFSQNMKSLFAESAQIGEFITHKRRLFQRSIQR